MSQRFYFHICDGVDVRDDEGVLLGGTFEARAVAVFTAGSLLRDLGSRFWNRSTWAMEVTDEQGATVCKLSFVGETASS